MAELFVKHTLNPRKVAKFNLNLKNYVLKGEEEKGYQWVLEIGTTTLSSSGTKIKPYYIHNVSEEDIEKEIEKAVSEMCTLMDWSSFDEDKYSPIFKSFHPEDKTVKPKTVVEFNIIEESPSSGIDLSNMSVVLNNGDVDFDITSELLISGDPYDYTLKWYPPNFNE